MEDLMSNDAVDQLSNEGIIKLLKEHDPWIMQHVYPELIFKIMAKHTISLRWDNDPGCWFAFNRDSGCASKCSTPERAIYATALKSIYGNIKEEVYGNEMRIIRAGLFPAYVELLDDNVGPHIIVRDVTLDLRHKCSIEILETASESDNVE